MRHSKSTGRQVYRSLLWSYLVILFLPLLISCIVFYVSIFSMLNQTNDLYRASVTRIQSIMDTQIRNLSDTNYFILNHPSTNNLKYYSGDFNSSKISLLRQLQLGISKRVGADPILNGAYIIFANGDVMLSNTNVYYGEDIDRHMRSTLWISREELVQLMDFKGTSRYQIFARDNGSRTDYVMLHLQKDSMTAQDVVVINVIDLQSMYAMLEDFETSFQARAIIADPISGVLLSRDASSNYEYYKAKDHNSLNLVSLIQGTPILVSTRSELNGWEYAIVVSLDQFVGAYRSALLLMAGYFALCMVGGITLIISQTRRHYSPVQNLMEKLSDASDILTVSRGHNEYDYIQKATSHLLQEKKVTDSKLIFYNNAVRDNAVREMMKSPFSDVEFSVLEEKYHIKLQSDRFIVIVCSAPDSLTGDVPFETIFSTITQYAQVAAPQHLLQYIVTLEGQVAILINVPNLAVFDLLHQVEQYSENLWQHILTLTPYSLVIGISDIHHGISAIPTAYLEAREVTEYISVLGLEQHILRFDYIDGQQSDKCDLSNILDKEQAFLNCMKVEDYTNARVQINQLIEVYFNTNICTLHQAKLRMYGLINSAITAFEEIRHTIDQTFFEQLNPIERLYKAKSVSVLLEEINSIFDQLLAYSSEQKQKHISHRAQSIEKYVQDNFMDPSISVSSVSEVFNISTSYLSKIFKNHASTGLHDYIHQLRVNEAKRLMREENLNIKDTAERVGYTNGLTMMRAFRRYEGVTPTSYKNNFI